MGSEVLLTMLLAAFSTKALPRRASETSPVVLSKRMATRLLVRQVIPEYPPLAKINYVQGKVDLQVIVTPRGRVGKVHVLRGQALLAAAALKAVRRWHYRPYVGAHGPESFETHVRVNFALRIWKIASLPSHPARDFARQVKPPQVVRAPTRAAPGQSVRMRVLVGKNGRVLDAEPIVRVDDQASAAHASLRNWKFLPAHWGTLAIPWYVEVNVPVASATADHRGATSATAGP